MESKVFSYNGAPITFKAGNTTMVNATEMAKPFGESKRAKNWLALQSTREFIAVLSEGRNLPSAELVKVTYGNNGGTWMHEDVALEFARWLSPQFAIWCNDRIKELMRHGITATPAAIESILADPANAILMLQALQEERKRNASLEDKNRCYVSENRRLQRLHTQYQKQLEAQAPKVEYADNVLNSENTYTTTQIAKELGMTAQSLNKILKGLGVQFHQSGQWLLYAKYQAKGYTKTRTHTYTRSNGRINTNITLVWTEAGRMFIHTILKKYEIIKSSD
ncbi:MAG: phage antirepressor KilAC domain-containing protein [Lachnospiraceae bacterium]|nr:phage antirepressor KilAC domain-containing protein [Lachnospiraceae bacterium]